MSRTKKPKVKELTQTHAAVQTSQLTQLDQIWGFNESARYGTVDEVEYAARIKDMTRSDLENHARAVQCMVVESSERLRDMLLKQFRSYVAHLRKPSPVAGSGTISNRVPPEVQKILNEGR